MSNLSSFQNFKQSGSKGTNGSKNFWTKKAEKFVNSNKQTSPFININEITNINNPFLAPTISNNYQNSNQNITNFLGPNNNNNFFGNQSIQNNPIDPNIFNANANRNMQFTLFSNQNLQPGMQTQRTQQFMNQNIGQYQNFQGNQPYFAQQQSYPQSYRQLNDMSLPNYETQQQLEFLINHFFVPLFDEQIQIIKNAQQPKRSRSQILQNQIFMKPLHNPNFIYETYKRKRNHKNKSIEVIVIQDSPYRRMQKKKRRQAEHLNKIKKNISYAYEEYKEQNILENQQLSFSLSQLKKSTEKQNKTQSNYDYILKQSEIGYKQRSDFNETVNLQYSIDIRWVQESERVLKTFSNSILISQKPTFVEIQEAILKDLESQGLKLQRESKLKMKECLHKKYTPNLLSRWILRRKQQQTKDYFYVGTIYKRKIVLPEGYDFSPRNFKGFHVQDFTIMNQYGRIKWPGVTNLQNIDFINYKIQISENEIQCNIPQLEKQAIVQLYNLPPNLRNLKENKDIEKMLNKMLAKSNIQFILLNHQTRFWTIKIDFFKQQYSQTSTPASK